MTPLLAVLVGDRCHLDRVAAAGDGDDESGVVEVAGWTMLDERSQRFEGAATDAHDVLTGAERYSQEFDRAQQVTGPAAGRAPRRFLRRWT